MIFGSQFCGVASVLASLSSIACCLFILCTIVCSLTNLCYILSWTRIFKAPLDSVNSLCHFTKELPWWSEMLLVYISDWQLVWVGHCRTLCTFPKGPSQLVEKMIASSPAPSSFMPHHRMSLRCQSQRCLCWSRYWRSCRGFLGVPLLEHTWTAITKENALWCCFTGCMCCNHESTVWIVHVTKVSRSWKQQSY